jgi:hypothetical protein
LQTDACVRREALDVRQDCRAADGTGASGGRILSARSSGYIGVVVAGCGSDVSYGPIFSRFHRLSSHWDIRKKIQ